MTKTRDTALVPVEHIARSILIVRGYRVLLDAELAALYGVTTTRLNQQVRRNLRRFPGDFMFQLSAEEHSALMFRNARSKRGPRGATQAPSRLHRAGAIMAATILNSEREMSIYVVRAFVQLRDLLASNKELAKRLDELEARITRKLATHDQAITGMLKTIRELMTRPSRSAGDRLHRRSRREVTRAVRRRPLQHCFI